MAVNRFSGSDAARLRVDDAADLNILTSGRRFHSRADAPMREISSK